MTTDTSWYIYTGSGEVAPEGVDPLNALPEAPPWRQFQDKNRDEKRGETFRPSATTIQLVNISLYLRRPLLVKGNPGTGKSSLAYAIARELKLGKVLKWSINTRSTLKEGLYEYDALARLQDVQRRREEKSEIDTNIGRYIRLGAFGTALVATERPRVLLIDEIDKSDIDLPNDLLNVLEEGEFAIPEIEREPKGKDVSTIEVQTHDNEKVTLKSGMIRSEFFPIVVMTSNGEREFPPAFLRRCVRLDIKIPDRDELINIIKQHLGEKVTAEAEEAIEDFLKQQGEAEGDLATDQLLNLIYMIVNIKTEGDDEVKISELRKALIEQFKTNILKPLSVE